MASACEVPDVRVNGPQTMATNAPVCGLQGIQAHGAVMVIDPETLLVPYVSANTGDILGIDPEIWLQGTLNDTLSRKTRHDLQNLVSARSADDQEIERGPITIGGRDFWLCICHLHGLIVLQLEPLNAHDLNKGQSLQDLTFLVSGASNAESAAALQRRSARMLRAITGYDRVLICAAAGEANLEVVAESAAGDVPQVGFGRIAAGPFTRKGNRRTLVANIYAGTVPLLKRTPDLPDLDLSAAHMQSPAHAIRSTMQKDGFSAFWSQPILSRSGIWGLIVLQHEIPRRPPPHLRNVIALYAQFFETRLQLLTAQSR